MQAAIKSPITILHTIIYFFHKGSHRLYTQQSIERKPKTLKDNLVVEIYNAGEMPINDLEISCHQIYGMRLLQMYPLFVVTCDHSLLASGYYLMASAHY